MNTLLQRATRTALLALAIFTAGWCRAGETDQIMFLQLKLKDGVVTLVRSSVMPGRLKTSIASDKKGEIQLELTAADGSSLWSEVMADPAVQRLEYEDPEHPGKLKIKEVRVTETEFTVRVPFDKNAKQLKLHHLAKPARRVDAAKPGTTRKLLGTVTIPNPEGKP